jgi:nucleolar complex protein 3
MLLDTERTALGVYLPAVEDPDACQPLSTALWELALLARHYHPTTAKLARRVAAGEAGIAERPAALYRQFDARRGAFNPPIALPPPSPLAKRPPGTAVCGVCWPH